MKDEYKTSTHIKIFEHKMKENSSLSFSNRDLQTLQYKL